MTIVSIFLHVLERVRKVAASASKELFAPVPPLASGSLRPLKLTWEVSDRLQGVLERASAGLSALTHNCELVLLHFSHFGKGLMKRAKLHPDFFMQVRWPPSVRCPTLTAMRRHRSTDMTALQPCRPYRHFPSELSKSPRSGPGH
jgi:hypothetical protein